MSGFGDKSRDYQPDVVYTPNLLPELRQVREFQGFTVGFITKFVPNPRDIIAISNHFLGDRCNYCQRGGT